MHQLEAMLEQLIKQRTALINQFEALKQMARPGKTALNTLSKAIASIKNQFIVIEQKMHQIVQIDWLEPYEKVDIDERN